MINEADYDEEYFNQQSRIEKRLLRDFFNLFQDDPVRFKRLYRFTYTHLNYISPYQI